MSKVEIDRNSDTFIEFSEQYLGNGGKISSWDSDGNGVIDYQYIRYPKDSDDILYEETIIYSSNGIEFIALKNENGIPVSIKYEGRDVAVVKGSKENFFWIEEYGSVAEEQLVLETFKDVLTDGSVQLVKFDEQTRLTVIKIGSAYFCHRLSPSDIPQDEEMNE